jgi:transcriptional regulator with GAF, ATPase, and Fis domain
MTDRDLLAVRLGQLARELQHETDTSATLDAMVSAAVQLVPGAEEGSVSVVIARRFVDSHHATGPLPEQVDALQIETGQGPCLDAAFEHQTVRINDLRTAVRWPAFAARAAQTGALSMLAFQLYIEGDSLGALNLFSTKADAFDDESEHVGLLFAAHAAIAVVDPQKQGQLREAVASRDVIGVAKGILAERYKSTPEQAFLVLSRLSHDTDTKLREVAAQLVRSGSLPDQDANTGR